MAAFYKMPHSLLYRRLHYVSFGNTISSKAMLRLGLRASPVRRYATVKTANIDWNPVKTRNQLVKGKELTGKYSRKVVFALLCLTPVVTFALGVWQVRRLQWKNKLIAACEDRLAYKPIPMPANVTEDDLYDLDYRKVVVTGEFDYSREVFVGPRLHEGRKGYTVVCPLVQSNGAGEVIVDRGWIDASCVAPSSRRLRHLAMPQGIVSIECVVRLPPNPTSFKAARDKSSRLYNVMDITAMAEELHTRPIYLQALRNFHDRPEWRENAENTISNTVEKKGGWFGWGKSTTSTAAAASPAIDQIQNVIQRTDGLEFDTAEEFDPNQFINAGVPLGKVPKIDYKNNHMNYLITWFSLSFASSILLLYTLKKGRMINPREEKLLHARKIMD